MLLVADVLFLLLLWQEYEVMIDQMKQYDQNTLFVDFSHLQQFDAHLAHTIIDEYYRFEPFLRQALYNVVRARHADFALVEGEPRDVFVSFHNMQSRLTYVGSSHHDDDDDDDHAVES